MRGAEIQVPPLRERKEDIPLLVNHAVSKYAIDVGVDRPAVTQPAMMRMISYAWPGNVRELFNVVHGMVVSAENGEITVRDVPEEIRESEQDEEHATMRGLAGVGLDRLEKEAIRQTLAMTNGNREQTAKLLGIGERTLYRKLKEYGLR